MLTHLQRLIRQWPIYLYVSFPPNLKYLSFTYTFCERILYPQIKGFFINFHKSVTISNKRMMPFVFSTFLCYFFYFVVVVVVLFIVLIFYFQSCLLHNLRIYIQITLIVKHVIAKV